MEDTKLTPEEKEENSRSQEQLRKLREQERDFLLHNPSEPIDALKEKYGIKSAGEIEKRLDILKGSIQYLEQDIAAQQQSKAHGNKEPRIRKIQQQQQANGKECFRIWLVRSLIYSIHPCRTINL